MSDLRHQLFVVFLQVVLAGLTVWWVDSWLVAVVGVWFIYAAFIAGCLAVGDEKEKADA